jgi:hypothetical protein
MSLGTATTWPVVEVLSGPIGALKLAGDSLSWKLPDPFIVPLE